MYLSSFVGSRDNNFNLLRLLAALAVVVSHSYFIALGGKQFEPWYVALGVTPGSVAVDIFFVISGFLVTRSLEYRRNVTEFACARAMRIMPGFAVNLVFVALVFGAVFTTLPLSEYFLDGGLVTYVLRNVQLLFLPIPYSELPGLRLENGSLWTLPVEVCCYILLLCAWVMFRHARLGKRVDVVVLIGAAVAAGLALGRYFQMAGFHLAWMFASGAAAYYLRDRIRLSAPVALFGLVALLLSAAHRMTFQAVLLLALPYLVLCAAFLPGGLMIRSFNRLGDYSYGVYIYGAPVQFGVHQFLPSASVATHVAIAVPAVVAIAAVSWHVVEKPALRAVHRVATLARRIVPKAVSVRDRGQT